MANNQDKDDKKFTYKVLSPIALSGRIEKGELIKLTAAEAENIGKNYVKKVGKDDD